MNLAKKSTAVFSVNDRYNRLLIEDDFGFTHLGKSRLLLQDLFVYPSLSVRPSKSSPSSSIIKGKDAFAYFLKQKYVVLQGADLCGKTALVKTLYKDLSHGTTLVPVLVDGEDFSSASIDALFSKVFSSFRIQYSDELLEPYKQLPTERRALLIDNLHKSRHATDIRKNALREAKDFFSIIVATSNETMTIDDFYLPSDDPSSQPVLASAGIQEFSASGRGAIIYNWLRIGQSDETEQADLSRELEREQSVIDYLIGKKTLPSLPYLIIGILQARQDHNQDLSDPGSFGFLVQKLVLDSLAITKGKRKLIERKDAILRRCSFEMFCNGVENLSLDEFRRVTKLYAVDMKISVEADEILADLLHGRVLTELDGNLSYKYHHFYYYFLARHFIDEIEGPRAATIRGT